MAKLIDDIDEIARVAGAAVRAVLRRTRPHAEHALERAEPATISSFGEDRSLGLTPLIVRHHRPSAIASCGGKVVILTGRSADLPNHDELSRFLAEGSSRTVFVEGDALLALEPTLRLRKPKAREAVHVDGRAFEGILPGVFAPTFWVDHETQLVVPTPRDVEVLVSAGKAMPLVTRRRWKNGHIIHFAPRVVTRHRLTREGAPRVSPSELAESLGIEPDGVFRDEDSAMPAALTRAMLTMMLVAADLLAAALNGGDDGSALRG